MLYCVMQMPFAAMIDCVGLHCTALATLLSCLPSVSVCNAGRWFELAAAVKKIKAMCCAVPWLLGAPAQGSPTCTLGICRCRHLIAHSAMPHGATAWLSWCIWCNFGRHTCIIIIICPAVPVASGAPSAADRLQPGLYGPLPLAAFDRIAR
jgi:hypothetical protein